MKHNQQIGRLGEELALSYLLGKGFVLLEKNFRAERMEIDLVMKDGDVLVFVEVKTRSGSHYGRPCEAVDAKKRRHMEIASLSYLAENGHHDIQVRFDVIEVNLHNHRITHLINAFMAGE